MAHLQSLTTQMARQVGRAHIDARNTASPISSLPTELIRYIQLLAYSADAGPKDNISRVLSHISSSWRDVSLGNSFLWSDITLPSCHPHAFAELLQRSGQKSLALRLTRTYASRAFDSDRSIEDRLSHSADSHLFSHASSRLRELTLWVAEPPQLLQFADKNGIFPAIEVLAVGVTTIPLFEHMSYALEPHLIFQPTSRSMPKLKRLLYRSSLLPDLFNIGAQLTHLDLRGCSMDEPRMTEMLATCRNLKDFKICEATRGFTIAEQAHPVWLLPSLEHLEVIDCTVWGLFEILSRLSLPELVTLHIVFQPVAQTYRKECNLEADLGGQTNSWSRSSYFRVFRVLRTFVSRVDCELKFNSLTDARFLPAR